MGIELGGLFKYVDDLGMSGLFAGGSVAIQEPMMGAGSIVCIHCVSTHESGMQGVESVNRTGLQPIQLGRLSRSDALCIRSSVEKR